MPISKPGFTLFTAIALGVVLPASSYAQNPFEGAIEQTEQDPSGAVTNSEIVVVTPDPAVPGVNRNAPGFSERDCPYQSGTGNRAIVDSQAASLTDSVDCTAGNNSRTSSPFGFSGLSGNRNQTIGANTSGGGRRSGAIGDSDRSGVITTGAGSQGIGASGLGSEGNGSSGLGSEGLGSTGAGADGAGAGG